MFVALFSTDLNKTISLYEIRKHKKNNSVLQNEIKQQNSRIEALLFEINKIKDRDENLRGMLKMPSIDKDTRELGVGGSPIGQRRTIRGGLDPGRRGASQAGFPGPPL